MRDSSDSCSIGGRRSIGLRFYSLPALAALVIAAAGCNEEWYRDWAQEEAYSAIESKHEEAGGAFDASREYHVEQRPLDLDAVGEPGATEDFARAPAPQPVALPPVEPVEGARPQESPSPPQPLPEPAPDAATPRSGEAVEPRREASAAPAGSAGPSGPPATRAAVPGAPQVPVRLLSLADAVRLALANNREYQASRESLYLSALALTLARYDFAPRFFGMVLGEYERDAAGEESGGVASSLGFNWLLPNGTRLVLSLANNFSQFFTGDRRELAMTILQGNVTQPVLRGFNREVVTEPLVQAERDLLYQVRAFERFRQTFAVRVVTEFYRVLQERDRVTNEYRNWQDLVQDTARVADLAEAGILATLELDQSRQQELQAKDRYFAAVQRYESALDGFKITLSIPVDEAVGLDPGELEKLAAQEVRALESPLADAVAVALDLRLDVLNARGEVEDTERRIRVVADSLRTQLDLNASASLASKDTRPLKFNGDEVSYGLGFTLDLPLDRKAERNDYVAALIAHESQKRERSLLEDNVRLTVRDAHRALDRETVTYGIQKASVALAEERVESTSLLRQAGRAETRDVLESLSALIEARNALTASLVNYTIARLEFFRDTGALKVSGDGTVTELALRVEAHD